MPHRTFSDSAGKAWQVWDVIPGWANRGEEYDRRSKSRNADRRGADGRWIGVHAELAQGWLCFSAEGEKRRLAPIPEGWENFSDQRLIELVNEASSAGQSRSV